MSTHQSIDNENYHQADLMASLLSAQKSAYKRQPMPTLEKRLNQLAILKNAIFANQASIIEAINQDFTCRSESETKIAEIGPLLEQIRYIEKNLAKWMKISPRILPIQLQPGRAHVLYQPLGVVGIISPWNYPLLLSLAPLAIAFAAGNRVMLKPSEFTPKTSQIIKEILARSFSSEEVCVVIGDSSIGNLFSKLPFDHLLFTGSTQVGKIIMRNAAENLTPVTLELGGKSPVILSNTACLQTASKRIAFGKYLNAGQTCIAPDYILVPDDKINELEQILTKKIKAMYPHIGNNKDYTSIVHANHKKRLTEYLDDATQTGARIVSVISAKEDLSSSPKMAPTLVFNPPLNSKVMENEIFGPILCIIGYSGKVEDAVAFINERPRPLALYLFSQSEEEIQYVTTHTHSGGLCINDTLMHAAVDDLPFGGIGASGMGHYHGQEGFLTFSTPKAILIRKKLSPIDFILPPWNRLIHKLLFNFFLKK